MIESQFVDIGNASSRMKKKELAFCQKNDVKVTEIKVGYDGIVVANSKKGTKLSSKYNMRLRAAIDFSIFLIYCGNFTC